jgi:hypothetical protein
MALLTPGLLTELGFLPLFLATVLMASSMAWFKSAIKSYKSSTPTEILIKLSVIPRISLISAGTLAWVIMDGISIKLSTPPKLSAQKNSFKLFTKVVTYCFSPLK